MRSLRLVSTIPEPRELRLPRALKPVGSGGFGLLDLPDTTEREEEELRRNMLTAMQAGVSVGVAPTKKRIRAIFFDMDATVIVEESLVELARAAGTSETVAAITERAMAGEIDFVSALNERVATLKGLPSTILAETAARLTLTGGIQAFAAFAREIGLPVFLVSGGFNALAADVCRRVGIPVWHANELEVANGKLTGRVTGEIVDAAGKLRFVESTMKRLGLGRDEVCAVGDGANDLPMLEFAGVAVGFSPKTLLLPNLDAANFSGDHRFLAPLLFGRDVSVRRGGRKS